MLSEDNKKVKGKGSSNTINDVDKKGLHNTSRTKEICNREL